MQRSFEILNSGFIMNWLHHHSNHKCFLMMYVNKAHGRGLKGKYEKGVFIF